MIINDSMDDIPLSVFDKLNKQIEARRHQTFLPLHQGKTTYPPCATLAGWEPNDFELQGHQHAPPAGIRSLREAILEKMTARYSRDVTDQEVAITCGATHAIATVLKVILCPGDEALLLSPQWLFAYGLVRAANAVPVEVPVFGELSKDGTFDFISMLESSVTSKTKAIYFNNPNNPTGISLNRDQLLQLALFAEKHDLWIVADNAYENYDYTSNGFVDIAELAAASHRTFSVYTFSKTYAMPGYRIGYVVSPKKLAERVLKMSLYSIYSASTASQFGAFQALKSAPSVLAEYHSLSKEARDIVVMDLDIPFTVPQGGIYSFLDLTGWNGGDTEDFISASIENGVSLAPGVAFGKNFSRFARLCFTSVKHDDLRIALTRLNDVYNRYK